MALWFVLKVNEHVIGSFQARRVEGGTDPDDVNTYATELDLLTGEAWSGLVSHRYGDGAFALVRRALEAAGKLGEQSKEAPR